MVKLHFWQFFKAFFHSLLFKNQMSLIFFEIFLPIGQLAEKNLIALREDS